MRVILHNLTTATFLKSQTEWTAIPNDACDLQDVVRAMSVAHALRSEAKRLEIHFLSENGQPLFVIPLAPASGASSVVRQTLQFLIAGLLVMP